MQRVCIAGWYTLPSTVIELHAKAAFFSTASGLSALGFPLSLLRNSATRSFHGHALVTNFWHTGCSTQTSSSRQLVNAWSSCTQSYSTWASARHSHLLHRYRPSLTAATPTTTHVSTRAMGSGTQGMDPAVLSKARRLALWVGCLAGMFGSLVGVGGGVLISPIIANACRSLPQRVISGTSLAAVVAVGLSSGVVYKASGVIDVTSAAVVAVCAVLTAPLGAKATTIIDCSKLRQATGYWLYFVAPLIPLKAYLFSLDPSTATADVLAASASLSDAHVATSIQTAVQCHTTDAIHTHSIAPSQEASDTSHPASLRQLHSSDALLGLVGGVAGFASGLLGIGGGTVVTPLLAILTGMPQIHAVGTSLAAMVLPAVVGLAQHTRLGNVDWRMAAALIGGASIGSLTGSNIALNAPPYTLEAAFSLGMLYLGHRTLALAKLTKTK